MFFPLCYTFSMRQNENEKYMVQYIKNFAMPECRKGNLYYLGAIQAVFLFPNEVGLKMEAALINEELLSGISAKKLIWLSENFRSWQYDADVYWKIDWNMDLDRQSFSGLSDSQYCSVLKLGTFACDGYFRQRCMERLDGQEGTLPFFLLRMNDWAQPIRKSAFLLAEKRLACCGVRELFFSLPVLEKIRNSRRREEDRLHSLEQQMESVVGEKFRQMTDAEIDGIHKDEISVRNAVYRFVNRNRVLERNRMERLLSLEKTGYGKMLLVLGIFRHYGYDRAKAEEYLASKSAMVRYYTLLYRYEVEQDAWAGMEGLLLDKSRRIRENVCYILVKRRRMDVAAYYLRELERQVSAVALLGVGETGTRQDTERIAPFLEADSEQLRKAALTAYGRLAGETGAEVYWRFLLDDNPVLANCAYRLILKYNVCYDEKRLYNAFTAMYLANPARKRLFDLLVREPSWKRLIYLLRLFFDDGIPADWRSTIIMAGGPFRSLYARITGQEAQEIRDILVRNKDKLPQGVREEILFGLKYVAER